MHATGRDQDKLRPSRPGYIMRCPSFRPNRHQGFFLLSFGVILMVSVLVGCSSCCSLQNLEAIEYAPLSGDDWEVSTPAEQGLDPTLVARLYCNAVSLETVYSVLVVKNGLLIAEDYFNGASIDRKENLQSVTKSYVSALVGIALEQRHLTSLDQKMMDFFPELVDQITDSRKMDITIEHLLQMRAGYPWEESSPELFEVLWTGVRASNLVDFPLVRDPGAGMAYSNLSTHLLGIIVSRATDMDLLEFGEESLFSLIGAEVGDWRVTWDTYRLGHAGVNFTARDAAKFGLLYLNDGVWEGTRIISSDWVAASLETYSEDAFDYRVGRNLKDIGYGYQWWSARSGVHEYNLAWGHGGQLVFLVHDLDMVVVVTADPYDGQSDGDSWKHEKASINLVADFISSVPSE